MSPRSDPGQSGLQPEQGFRASVIRRFMRIPAFRRWHVRRTLSAIDKAQAQGRRLPDGLADTARFLSRLPKQQRAKFYEEAIVKSLENPTLGREQRRSVERQRHTAVGTSPRGRGNPSGSAKQKQRHKR